MKPYVPFELNELTALRSVEKWSNRRVRVFGKVGLSISGPSCSLLELRYLHSVGEERDSDVIVDFSLILDVFNGKFTEGSVVQILGELEPFNSSTEGKLTSGFIVRAHIIRDFSTVDPKLYHKASTLQSIACPRDFYNSPLPNSNSENENHSFQDELEMDLEMGEPDKESSFKNDCQETKKRELDIDNRNDSSIDMFADSD